MMSGRGGSVKDCRGKLLVQCCARRAEWLAGAARGTRGRVPWPRSDATSARGATGRDAEGRVSSAKVVGLLVSIAGEAVDEVLERLLAARDGWDVDVGGQHLVGEFGEGHLARE